MTNKEAIDFLQDWKSIVSTDFAREAFDKAIEALKKEDANDWIYGTVPDPEWDRKFEEVEKALGFPLFIWQKTHIMGRGFKCYGATTAEILRDLLNADTEPIDYAKPTTSKREQFYRYDLHKIKEKLDAAGIRTRPVFFCETDKINYYREQETEFLTTESDEHDKLLLSCLAACGIKKEEVKENAYRLRFVELLGSEIAAFDITGLTALKRYYIDRIYRFSIATYSMNKCLDKSKPLTSIRYDYEAIIEDL